MIVQCCRRVMNERVVYLEIYILTRAEGGS